MTNGIYGRKQIIRELAERTDMSQKAAQEAVDALFDPQKGILAGALRRGSTVQITGFGSFQVRQRKARMGRNPQTGREIRIPSMQVPVFKAGKGLKDRVRG